MRRAIVWLVIALAAAPLPAAVAAPARPGPPTALTADGWPRPLGVDPATLTFAWQVVDPRPGARQSAYRVVVTRAGAPVWDSGQVAGGVQAVPYGGPPLAPDTVYSWTVQTWDVRGQPGPQAAAVTFSTGLGDHDWAAHWISRATSNPLDTIDNFTYARKDVALGPSPVTRATAYVSADQFYELWINGARAGKGPAISYPDTQHYEALDVSGLLRAGRPNAVGLLTHWYGKGKGRPDGVPGAILQISVTHADGSRSLIVTDGSWRVERGNWLASTPRNQQMDDIDYTENISGLTEPVGWDQPGFDDRLWAPATDLGRPPAAPWAHLVAQQTHIVEEPLTPTVTTLPTGAVVADFGTVTAAVPTVTFHHGVPGRTITMRGGYLLDPGGSVSTMHGTQSTDMSYSYVQRAGTQTFHPYDYLGFRYFQIDDPGETLRPSDVVAWARHNQVPDEHAATFASSSPTVDAVWELARHSALSGSQEQFIDTPTREKSPFLRDSYNISETAMAAFGEQNLTGRVLLEFAQSQARYWPDGRLNAVYPSGDGKRDIPDFTEIYPDWVWQYWLETGDRATVARVYPVVAAIAAYVAQAVDPRTGLVTNLAGGDDNPDYQHGIVDWPPNMRYGYDMNTVARTTVNMISVSVFRRAADLADALGRPAAEVQAERDRAANLTAAINARLVRGDGLYIDGLHAGGTPSSHASEHANAYALAYGIAAPSRQAALADYVASLGMQMGPQTAQELLAGLDGARRDDAVVARLTDAHADGWANELAQGGTFTWETWRPSDANGDSMSHGWGATVLVEIQRDLLGARPTGPGWSTFDIVPPASGLDRASGVVPTPRGPISVSWVRGPGGTVSVDLTVPANAVATLRLPAAAGPAPVSVSVDGRRAPPGPVALGSGSHRLSGAVPAATPSTSVRLPPSVAAGRPIHRRFSWWWVALASVLLVVTGAWWYLRRAQ